MVVLSEKKCVLKVSSCVCCQHRSKSYERQRRGKRNTRGYYWVIRGRVRYAAVSVDVHLAGVLGVGHACAVGGLAVACRVVRGRRRFLFRLGFVQDGSHRALEALKRCKLVHVILDLNFTTLLIQDVQNSVSCNFRASNNIVQMNLDDKDMISVIEIVELFRNK